jgi:hypothetical protein
MVMVEQAGRVSAFPTIHFALTSPATGGVSLVMEPDPGAVYHTVINEGRDTVTLVVTGLLAGNTRYEIFPAGPITAEDGGTLAPEDAVFTILTHATENEPNDRPDTTVADRFIDPVYGFITTALDTDYYRLSPPLPAGIYLYSPDKGRCNVAVIDDEGRRIVARTLTGGDGGRIDTLIVADTLAPPLWVQVFSFTGVASVRYELGATETMRAKGHGVWN